MLQSMGSQRVRHDLAIEEQQQYWKDLVIIISRWTWDQVWSRLSWISLCAAWRPHTFPILGSLPRGNTINGLLQTSAVFHFTFSHFNTNTHHFIPFLPSLFFLPPFLSLFSLSLFNEVYTLCVILKTDFSLNKRCWKMPSIHPSIRLCFEFREDGQNHHHYHLWISAAVVSALALEFTVKPGREVQLKLTNTSE